MLISKKKDIDAVYIKPKDQMQCCGRKRILINYTNPIQNYTQTR